MAKPPRNNSKQKLAVGAESSSISQNSPCNEYKSSKTAYDANFRQHMVDFDHVFVTSRPKPSNLSEIVAYVNQSRESVPSATEEEFEKFQEEHDKASGDVSVMRKLLSILLGDSDIPSAEYTPFNNLKYLTDWTLATPTVDLYDGCEPKTFDRRIRSRFAPLIEPNTREDIPCLPNVFFESKGPLESSLVAENQILYHSCLGTRAMHSLRTSAYGDAQALDGKAYTLAALFVAERLSPVLSLYTSHVDQFVSSPHDIKCRVKKLNGWDLTGNINNFREAVRWLRNARIWARDQRLELAIAANQKMRSLGEETLEPTTESTASELVSSTDPDDLTAE